MSKNALKKPLFEADSQEAPRVSLVRYIVIYLATYVLTCLLAYLLAYLLSYLLAWLPACLLWQVVSRLVD